MDLVFYTQGLLISYQSTFICELKNTVLLELCINYYSFKRHKRK